jgi:hypothetical protein
VFVQQQLQKAAHHDDPVLLELNQQHPGKWLFGFEATKKNRKTYRVTSIETYKHDARGSIKPRQRATAGGGWSLRKIPLPCQMANQARTKSRISRCSRCSYMMMPKSQKHFRALTNTLNPTRAGKRVPHPQHPRLPKQISGGVVSISALV